MPANKFVIFLRNNWMWFLIGALLVGAGAYVVSNSNRDPWELLKDYGYLVIIIWTFLEGETIVILSGIFADTLGLNPLLIALCAFGGSFASDQVMFSLGKYKGESVLKRFPKLNKNVGKAARLFKKYDIALILGFRFVYGVRNVTPILLGISGVSHKKFFFLNIIGASVWAFSFTYGGVYAGEAFMTAIEHLGYGIFYIIIGAVLLGVAWWGIKKRRTLKRVRAVMLKRKQQLEARKRRMAERLLKEEQSASVATINPESAGNSACGE